MKSSDRAIVMGIGVLGLVAAFWFLVLSPKREEATKLGDEVATLEEEVALAEQEALAGELAQDGFEDNYQNLVVLGKAVPADGDTASLLLQLQGISEETDVDFRGITLQSTGSSDAQQIATPPPLVAPGEEATPEEGADAPPAEAVPTAAPATEAAAAMLPIGATVGPAGLPVMPYALTFQGGFFAVADFMAELDEMVHLNKAKVDVDGRLLTVDGFSLQPDPTVGFPVLDVNLAVTTYLTPAAEGAVAGATPTGPPATPAAAPAAAPATPPAAAVTP